MAPFDWDLARRRDVRADPNLKLDADRTKTTVLRRLGNHPMSFTPHELRQDPDGAREHADEIQLRLDSDLELCRWAAEALPSTERRKFLRRAEREHKEASMWLAIMTGEAFSTKPVTRHRIGRRS